MSQLNLPQLYLIAPRNIGIEELSPKMEEACKSKNIASLLLSLPEDDIRSQINYVKTVAPIAQKYDTAVVLYGEIYEDLGQVALHGGADGVHVSGVGQHVRMLRDILGTDRILGVGDLTTKDDAMRAGEEGADYLLFGKDHKNQKNNSLSEVFEQASWWAEIFEIPCVAYADSLNNFKVLATSGAEFIAIDNLVWNHGNGAEEAVKELKQFIQEN